MKRIFTIIVILVTISLVGIIMLQLSWLNNMILLRQEQIKEKVNQAVSIVGAELSQYKGNLTPLRSPASSSMFPDDFSLDFLRPQTIGKKFTAQELHEKIATAFRSVGLERMSFEFELALMNPRTNLMGTTERQSNNYEAAYADTINNYSRGALLISPSGSAAEGVAFDETLTVVALDWRSFALQSLRWRFAIAILFTIIIISAFYLTLRTMLRQKKLAKIKNDFINNMTHEFKTPIATISLAVDAMRNEKVLEDREKLHYFSTIIKEENQRMNRQVETILKASQLEKQQTELNLKPVHVHEIIGDVVDNFTLQLQQKNGRVELELNAKDDLIEADEVHFSNLVNNLVDNAVKYSKENVPLLIRVSTESNTRNFILRIEDNGIGMNRETLKRIFERFYRAHTGNIHNVKGFGLGLSYVETMVEAHGGQISADSALGKGSVFTVELPLKKT
ncbi:MAG TPA: HAMP domain-containing sensor histidine kinase [Chitinophagaceae bacterium]|nr:HAMP domain-containing sensor histidine kinase [Chitinophagaceae bacterium]